MHAVTFRLKRGQMKRLPASKRGRSAAFAPEWAKGCQAQSVDEREGCGRASGTRQPAGGEARPPARHSRPAVSLVAVLARGPRLVLAVVLAAQLCTAQIGTQQASSGWAAPRRHRAWVLTGRVLVAAAAALAWRRARIGRLPFEWRRDTTKRVRGAPATAASVELEERDRRSSAIKSCEQTRRSCEMRACSSDELRC
ncbi:hypothetical protein FA09DRAFT_152212 [Tilletiopsis washingtonensis]|uniref:Uncharacterized protein n=1 Tax=Tilletiopsis washingtonensis TaxID=58919 RepID=A0A316Z4M5_9BASI|nr:hypothetical protein FA09DRAFT_152212 [Tilletiopsis washingtonensis]PWN95155.1 hypothetical protein FA09DRAFT_152212 [Tilletiopsis washingtonensis]